MSEKLLPCPFCGSDNVVRGGDDKMVAVFCGTCGACGPDEYGSSNEWNRRTPAPEGEAWRHVSQEEMAQAAKFASNNLASPVVPAPERGAVKVVCCSPDMFGTSGCANEVEALAVAIWAHRCPGMIMDDEGRAHYEAAATAAFTELDQASPVVPVGVSREVIAEILKDEVLTDDGIIMSSEPSSKRRLRIAERIIAALRPTDTGRE
jgi:hypothetical protein